ncbi:hypothetical protein WA026_020205 [Henosepilachna vigintioctopunctata]|uniref:Carbonic anhydrase n=1 Tax=Henosepilachna vigintioctopunctata TaxID=420089 RepID=A0AAW1U2F8_9CUCU
MSSHWGYCQSNGPQTWAQSFPVAAGDHQSPVDIRRIDVKNLSCQNKLKWNYTPNCVEEVTNTGHGWQVRAKHNTSILSGGPLQENYGLLQFHCHWGKTDEEGSEHTIDGIQYAGELHLVHWNFSKYSSIAEAFEHPDGLCVLGVLLKPGRKHEELEKIIKELPKIEFKNQTTPISPPFDPAKLLPSDGGSGYFTYKGSLTTPPCSECVIWIVFKDPIEVSLEQLKAFRSLKCCNEEESCPCNNCEGLLENNFRPTFPIGKREILESL